jgi:type IV pilus assembly protein PilQ
VRRAALAFFGLAVICALAGPATGQQSPRWEQYFEEEGGTITLDVRDRSLLDVVNFIRDKTSVNIIVSAEAEQTKVTLSVRDLHWFAVLKLASEKAECIVVAEGKNLVKVEKPPQVTFEFDDADIRKVISMIAAYSGANIVVGQEVQGTVTVRLNRVPWRSALDTVVKTLGFVVVEDDRSILRVTDPGRLIEQLETRVFTFRFVRPPPMYVAKITTEVSDGSLKAPSDDIEKEFRLLAAFRNAVKPEGDLEYIRSTNSVVATGTAPKLDKLEELIAQVDTEPVMVGVDIHFAVTKNTDFLDVGIDPGEKGFRSSIDFGSMQHRLPFNLGEGGWEDRISVEGELKPGGDVNSNGPLPVAAGTGFTFGKLDFTGAQFTLRLLKRDVSTRIVQAPKILTLDNQAATLFVGETIRYAQTTAESNQQGGLQFSIQEASESPAKEGFQLFVIPHVIPGTNKVMMTVIPQQESLTGTSTEQPGFNIFRGGTGANEVQIALPQTASSTVVTHMLLESGETAVLGGLLTDVDSKTVNRIPLLSDIPILGYLFKNEQTSKTKDHLIIMVTPQIMQGAAERRAALSEELRLRHEQIQDEWGKIAADAEKDPKEE